MFLTNDSLHDGTSLSPWEADLSLERRGEPLEDSLAPIIRRALRVGKGPSQLVRWVRQQFLDGEEPSGHAAAQWHRVIPFVARALGAHLRLQLEAEPRCGVAARETVVNG
jgi:hypothetical protein